MIGTPGHENNKIADDVNICDKRYLIRGLCIIGMFEINNSESRMKARSVIGKSNFSLTEDNKHVCDDKERVNGVKGCSNFKKKKYYIEKRFNIYNIIVLLR